MWVQLLASGAVMVLAVFVLWMLSTEFDDDIDFPFGSDGHPSCLHSQFLCMMPNLIAVACRRDATYHTVGWSSGCLPWMAATSGRTFAYSSR
jgi:hypothetical protein